MRQTGIAVIGSVPWGTHICQLYDTKQDLLQILVPYFKSGLENNEFCIWVTGESLREEEIEQTMSNAMPSFEQYAQKQMEIISYTEWYIKDSVFDLERVLKDWLGKLHHVLARGYAGVRITGDADWLQKENWQYFAAYEKRVDSAIGKYQMLAICTYPLAKFGPMEVIDVACHHKYVLIKRAGDWVLLKPGGSHEAVLKAEVETPLTPLQRMFIKSGFEGFNDQEIIELLLSLCLPAGYEHKSLAEESIERFKSLRGFLSASAQELEHIGLNSHFVFFIKLLLELPAEILKQKIIERSVHSSSKEVFDYLRYSMQDLKKEVFKVLYLNNQNQILGVVDLFEGTLDSIPIRPREIVESALKQNATRLIFVHNHPSGEPTPSRSDKQLTRDLVFMGMILQIGVLDHIIIGMNRYFSFADEGLIKKYEDHFLNLRIKSTGSFQDGNF